MSYEEYRKEWLVQACSLRGLPITGTRKEMIERLTRDDEQRRENLWLNNLTK